MTTDARALWKANNGNTLSTLQQGKWIDLVPIPASFPTDPQDIYFHWLKTGVVAPYNECAQMSMYERKVISFWVHHPGDKLELMPLTMQWLWQPSVVETSGRPGEGGILDTLRTTAEPGYMIPLYVLAAIGLFLVPRSLGIFVVLLLGYQTAAAALFVGETRYRAPWDFLIGLLAAMTVVALARRRGWLRSSDSDGRSER